MGSMARGNGTEEGEEGPYDLVLRSWIAGRGFLGKSWSCGDTLASLTTLRWMGEAWEEVLLSVSLGAQTLDPSRIAVGPWPGASPSVITCKMREHCCHVGSTEARPRRQVSQVAPVPSTQAGQKGQPLRSSLLFSAGLNAHCLPRTRGHKKAGIAEAGEGMGIQTNRAPFVAPFHRH